MFLAVLLCWQRGFTHTFRDDGHFQRRHFVSWRSRRQLSGVRLLKRRGVLVPDPASNDVFRVGCKHLSWRGRLRISGPNDVAPEQSICVRPLREIRRLGRVPHDSVSLSFQSSSCPVLHLPLGMCCSCQLLSRVHSHRTVVGMPRVRHCRRSFLHFALA